MNKNILWIVFAISCLLQWAAPLMQISGHEKVIAEGALVSFRCQAPDPYDMLRGRFLAVRVLPETFELAGKSYFESGEFLYALIEPDADGLVVMKNLTREKPLSGVFVKVKNLHTITEHARIEWPFDRFYLNEKIAPKADEWYRKNVRTPSAVTAEVRVLNGKAVLVDLKLEGRSFKQILSEMGDQK
jgi:hypothetical protein